jgi:solute carrier family 13 (sodium-dependent dicarboxylate transporter), member 2/3/5
LNKRYLALAAGPVIAFLIWILSDLNPGNRCTTYMAGIAVWMCIWWMTEAVNLAITALLPVLLFPLFKIASVDAVAPQYTDSIIFLFIGGFMMAFAIEKWGLHKRIALKVLSLLGSNPQKILFGVMLSAYLISNWISNTATTIMLLSAVISLVDVLEEVIEKKEDSNKLAAALLLGLAFAATIGGMATPVGTPPNMFFFNEYLKKFPDNNDLNFLTWAKVGFPLSFSLLLFTYFTLSFYYLRKVKLNFDKSYFDSQLKKLGRFSYEEKIVLFLFSFCVMLWLSREKIQIGNFIFNGWGSFFDNLNIEGRKIKLVGDASVAILAAILLFIIPSKKDKGKALLQWEDAQRLRYDIILMFGGGFALAYGFKVSELDKWLADSLFIVKGMHSVILTLAICMVVCLISEFASNIASIQLVMPVMIAMQPKLGIPALQLLIPATFAASLGFILPVATAANTIVFGTKRIQIRDMLNIGIVLDLGGIILITLFTYLFL